MEMAGEGGREGAPSFLSHLAVAGAGLAAGVSFSLLRQSLRPLSPAGVPTPQRLYLHPLDLSRLDPVHLLLSALLFLLAFELHWRAYGWLASWFSGEGGVGSQRARRVSSPFYLLAWAAGPVAAIRWDVHNPNWMSAVNLFFVAFVALQAGYLFRSAWRRSAGGRPVFTPGKLFAAFLALYLTLQFLHTERNPTGDEPEYLLAAHSLLVDGDLELSNNVRGEHYLAFRSKGRENAFRATREPFYSLRGFGMPWLLLPGYALAGRYGAQLVVNLLAALTVLLCFQLARAIVGGEREAALGACLLGVAGPFVFYANLLFPEVPAAFLHAAGLVLLARAAMGGRPALFADAGLALVVFLLPLLRFRYMPLAAGLALAALLLRRWRGGLLSLLALGGSSLAQAAYNLPTFGTWVDLGVLTGDNPVRWVSPWRLVPQGLGLLLDREVGLWVYGPLWLLVPLGGWWLARARGRLALALLLPSALQFLALATNVHNWTGDWSPPGRFLVSLAPALVLALAAWFRCVEGFRWRSAAGLWVGLSLLLSLAGLANEDLLYNRMDGEAALFGKLRWALGVNPGVLVPSFTVPSAASYALAGLYLFLFALWCWRSARRTAAP